MQLISLVGSAGSGKNAVADILIEQHAFQNLAFAGCLKDAVAVIFNWDRALLEGDTAKSRAWRETVDPWWARELGMPGLSPRIVLQKFGTEVIRNGFHGDIWLLTVKRKIAALGPDAKIVITDARFPNELGMTSDAGGKIVRVKRGPNPVWWKAQLRIAAQSHGFDAAADQLFAADYALIKDIHESERAWARETYDFVIENDSTLDALTEKTEFMLETLTWTSTPHSLPQLTALLA